MSGINLDQIIAESQRTSLPLTLGGNTFDLPGELPLDVFAPFLADDLGLAAVLGDVVKAVEASDAEGGVKITDLIVDTLIDHPMLPLSLVHAARESLELLLGAEAYAAFWALRPTLPTVVALVRALVAHYGVSLLDFSDSDDSSQTSGEPSKPTSPASTDSTPEASGDVKETPADS